MTSLYGWVEWQMGVRPLPPIVEREHRAAFAAATGEVTDATKAQL